MILDLKKLKELVAFSSSVEAEVYFNT